MVTPPLRQQCGSEKKVRDFQQPTNVVVKVEHNNGRTMSLFSCWYAVVFFCITLICFYFLQINHTGKALFTHSLGTLSIDDEHDNENVRKQ